MAIAFRVVIEQPRLAVHDVELVERTVALGFEEASQLPPIACARDGIDVSVAPCQGWPCGARTADRDRDAA